MGMAVRPNILIVDDDDTNLHLLVNILKILDVNLIQAQSGSEALLKIDHILYIHNKSQQKGNDLIFGHSWHPTEWAKQREEQMPEGLSELEEDEWIQEQSDNYDYSIMRGYEAIDSFFSSIYKDSKTIIDRHKAFFSSLSNIEIINIIGHSLSIVDKPYFEEIANYINKGKVIWKATYHEDKDAVRSVNETKTDAYFPTSTICPIIPK